MGPKVEGLVVPLKHAQNTLGDRKARLTVAGTDVPVAVFFGNLQEITHILSLNAKLESFTSGDCLLLSKIIEIMLQLNFN